VLVHRLVSAKLVNNFAFLVISLTMLGFALSGVVLSRWRGALLARRDEAVIVSAALFALTMVASSWAFCAPYQASSNSGCGERPSRLPAMR